MTTSAKLFLLAVLPCLGSVGAGAAEQDRISTDRPDFLTSPDVVGKGRFQIEFGALVERDDADNQRTRTTSTPTLLRLGLTDAMELRLESEGRMRTRATDLQTQMTVYEQGYADTTLGLKWTMRKGEAEQGTPSIGWIFQADLPSGSHEFRGRGVRPGVLGALQWELPNDTAFGLNVGMKYDNHETEGRHVSGRLGAGFSKDLGDRLSVVAEVVAQDIRRKKFGGSVVTADLGIAYLVTPSLQIDALVGHGLTNDSPKYLFTVGVSARF